MNGSVIKAYFPGLTELRNERVRATVLLAVLVLLLALVVIQGAVSVAYQLGPIPWPVVLILTAMAVSEALWLKFLQKAIETGKSIARRIWQSGILVEVLLPTIALALQSHSSDTDPLPALESPIAWTYFLLIILSTLRLDAKLSWLCGVCAAVGYAAVGISVYFSNPHSLAGAGMLSASASFSYIAFLLFSGYAAGAIAHQLQLHAAGEARDAETRTESAQKERELSLARSIQERLIPKSDPQIKGYDVAGWNRPAEESGGDYYDWMDLGDGRMAFVIADVTGRGLESALAMASCHAWVRAYLATGAELESILPQLNALLCENLPSGKFITLAAGVLDPSDAAIHLISAGHGPLILYLAQERRFRRYDAQGLPLGLMQQATYSAPHYMELSPGDILVLATNGFTEWPNTRGQVFGQDGMKTVIQANRNQPAAKIISALSDGVVEFAGDVPQPDDLTALVIKQL